MAVGYVRVSTQEQVTEGVSLDAQRDKLKAYCKFNGIKLIDIKSDEGISGGTLADLSPHFSRFRPLAQVPCSPITTLVR